MFVDKFDRTGTNYDYASAIHPVHNFIPLTGGRLGGRECNPGVPGPRKPGEPANIYPPKPGVFSA